MRKSRAKLHKSTCCKPGYRGELCELLEALLRDAINLFDKNNCLNSDGRRLFETIARMLIEEHPEHRGIVRRARRNPCIDEVLRMARVFYICDADTLYRLGRGLTDVAVYRLKTWQGSQ